jgi:hypothetical protein
VAEFEARGASYSATKRGKNVTLWKLDTIDQILNSDLGSLFNIDREEAERIAARAQNSEDFFRIWEHEDWWLNTKE